MTAAGKVPRLLTACPFARAQARMSPVVAAVADFRVDGIGLGARLRRVDFVVAARREDPLVADRREGFVPPVGVPRAGASSTWARLTL